MKDLRKKMKLLFSYKEFADSSINFDIRLWVRTPEQPEFLQVRSEAVMRIKKAFDENDITIPFPIRTLDFGIKGGLSLNEVSIKTGRERDRFTGIVIIPATCFMAASLRRNHFNGNSFGIFSLTFIVAVLLNHTP